MRRRRNIFGRGNPRLSLRRPSRTALELPDQILRVHRADALADTEFDEVILQIQTESGEIIHLRLPKGLAYTMWQKVLRCLDIPPDHYARDISQRFGMWNP